MLKDSLRHSRLVDFPQVSGILQAHITWIHSRLSLDDCFPFLLLDTCNSVITSTVPRLLCQDLVVTELEICPAISWDKDQPELLPSASAESWDSVSACKSLPMSPATRAFPLHALTTQQLASVGEGSHSVSSAMLLEAPQQDCLALKELEIMGESSMFMLPSRLGQEGPPSEPLGLISEFAF